MYLDICLVRSVTESQSVCLLKIGIWYYDSEMSECDAFMPRNYYQNDRQILASGPLIVELLKLF